jgi:ABC-type phosphate/phosphonate transport system substrate-binding protein
MDSFLVAALPMYDWPERRAEVDAEWTRLGAALRERGIDAPEGLARRNVDLPPVPGAIRDASGAVVASDPAMLPPDGLDLHLLWRHPRLLFAQTCWGPMELGMAEHVQVVGQPDYSTFEGGEGELYSSAIVMRRNGVSPSDPPAIPSLEGEAAGRLERDARAPADGQSLVPLERLRGRRFAYNSRDSMSGIIALGRDLDALGEGIEIFPEKTESGGHRASVVAVAKGRADVAAIDCRSWALAERFEPAAKELVVVGWTGRRKGLPYITARTTRPAVVAALRDALAAVGMTAPRA